MAQHLKPKRLDNRGGNGKVGRPKLNNVLYQRRIPPQLVKPMDEFLKKLKDDTRTDK